MWRTAGQPLEMGWHPCLTIDAPLLPPDRVPSLVDRDGRFLSLGQLLKRMMTGRLKQSEIEAEFLAQYQRFRELTGIVPANINAHHHIHVFKAVGEALNAVLAQQQPKPFLRRVVECYRTIRAVPGARRKRAFLHWSGSRAARRQHNSGLPGNETLIGITDPPYVHANGFLEKWIGAAAGNHVELSCHPGKLDYSLDGRDGTLADGHIHRRAREYELLSSQLFFDRVRDAGFRLCSAREMSLNQQSRCVRQNRAA